MRQRQKEREAERKQIEAERAKHFCEMAKRKAEQEGGIPNYTWLFYLGKLIWLNGAVLICLSILFGILGVFVVIRNQSIVGAFATFVWALGLLSVGLWNAGLGQAALAFHDRAAAPRERGVLCVCFYMCTDP